MLPVGQLALVVHEAQEWLLQVAPPLQSLLWQHVPLKQKPPQHFWPVPHWLSEEHALHCCEMQSWPPQSAFAQQLPGTHAPPQHLFPVPHWTSVVQAPHLPLAQTWPLVQSVLVQQLPGEQRLPPVTGQHREPAPQSAEVLQLEHVPATQARPPLH